MSTSIRLVGVAPSELRLSVLAQIIFFFQFILKIEDCRTLTIDIHAMVQPGASREPWIFGSPDTGRGSLIILFRFILLSIWRFLGVENVAVTGTGCRKG